jgi:hypothetical protein
VLSFFFGGEMQEGPATTVHKRVRNEGLLRLPREVLIHRLAVEAQPEGVFFTAKLLGIRKGVFSTTLQIERIDGVPLSRLVEFGNPAAIGSFIAGIEKHTHRLLSRRRQAILPELDFYQSEANLSRRYDVRSIVAGFLRKNPAPFAEFESLVGQCAAAVEESEARLVQAEPVLSHLDHFPKNFIRSRDGLFLIDWGEGYVGRPGFDAGCFLMVMLRAYDVRQFEQAAVQFFLPYFREAIAAPRANLLLGINRILIARSLWSLLRPDIVARIHAQGKIDRWKEKFFLLSRVASGDFWRDAGLGSQAIAGPA